MHFLTYKQTLPFLYKTISRKKDIRNILLLQADDKCKVGYHSSSISFIFSYLEGTFSQFIPKHLHLYICID